MERYIRVASINAEPMTMVKNHGFQKICLRGHIR